MGATRPSTRLLVNMPMRISMIYICAVALLACFAIRKIAINGTHGVELDLNANGDLFVSNISNISDISGVSPPKNRCNPQTWKVNFTLVGPSKCLFCNDLIRRQKCSRAVEGDMDCT